MECWLFFAWQQGLWSFVDIMLLWGLLVATVVAFWRVRPLAGILLLPYLAWVTFAAVLNLTMAAQSGECWLNVVSAKSWVLSKLSVWSFGNRRTPLAIRLGAYGTCGENSRIQFPVHCRRIEIEQHDSSPLVSAPGLFDAPTARWA